MVIIISYNYNYIDNGDYDDYNNNKDNYSDDD